MALTMQTPYLLLGWKNHSNIYSLRELYGFEKDTSEWIAEALKRKVPQKKQMWCDSAEPDRIKMWEMRDLKQRQYLKSRTV